MYPYKLRATASVAFAGIAIAAGLAICNWGCGGGPTKTVTAAPVVPATPAIADFPCAAMRKVSTLDPIALRKELGMPDAPLVITAGTVYHCPCGKGSKLGGHKEEARLGGHKEDARLGGHKEDARLGGHKEDARLGGHKEDARLGGHKEDARLGGHKEDARLGGHKEDARLGGHQEVLKCRDGEGQFGFNLYGLSAMGEVYIYESGLLYRIDGSPVVN